ncbi:MULTISPECIES: MucR family transcriptional regulator [Methylobacterium]|jgi:predicted transcriptional regulator|uniref:Predicted transcriptional regulator n=2 Tax=Methylobacterium TaxID=407 RepID=A0AAE8HQL5_9HYPH|nr:MULTISPECIES: MucR family transcriptional regulator [Methylobacterium]APT33635.1 transcriptional regulatory protein MucR [Methylobacterium phyllosphaerae]MBA9061240.1 putative transcriptional regulator [Methylobacterium fujisawaense]MBP28306.1 MucR family transcriptional regulator [Methylobacterium sp.]MDE4910616.1 MucR family transcriptional regulator [Methylobacterium sp. 092160098-2]RUP16225.1 MAG: MucR family transcriptional regulator [Methylobacterium sp.]
MEDSNPAPHQDPVDFVELTADIVSAYVANNSVPVPDLPSLLSGVHAALAGLSQTTVSAEPEFKKATPAQIKKSITPDALISFIDGKPYKTLKRHLTGNGMTIEQYRQRYGLPPDYPTTASTYSAMRAEFARNAGLGHKRRSPAAKRGEPAASAAAPDADGTKVAKGRKTRKADAEA